jgi:hypothetical protein
MFTFPAHRRSIMKPVAAEPTQTHARGVLRVIEIVGSRAAQDCAMIGALQARRLNLWARTASTRARGDLALMAELADELAALDVEIGLAMGGLAARNTEIARLRAALA